MTNAQIKMSDINRQALADKRSADNATAEVERKSRRDAQDKKVARDDRRSREKIAKLQDSTTRRGQTIKGVTDTWQGVAKLAPSIASLAANDPEWYRQGPSGPLIDTSIPAVFNRPLSANYTFPTNLGFETLDMPTLMVMRFCPTLGKGTGKLDDPVNRIAFSLFRKVQAVTKYNKDYQASDLMMMIGALDSCAMWLTHLERVYGLAQLYSRVNHTFPSFAVEALDIDWDDLQNHMADFRAGIDQRKVLLNKWAIPNIPLIKRHRQLCSALYCDDPNQRAASYILVPDYLWKFTVDSSSSSVRTQLTPVPYAGGTYTEMLNLFDTLYAAFGNNTDAANMSGDLQATFSDFLQLDATPVDYVVYPVYDRLMLQQIRNASLPPLYADTTFLAADLSYDQSADGAGLISSTFSFSTPETVSAPPVVEEGSFVGLWFDEQPNPGLMVEFTRLATVWTLNRDTTSGLATPAEFGSEFITGVDIYDLTELLNNEPIVTHVGYVRNFDLDRDRAVDSTKLLTRISCFDNHPRIPLIRIRNSEEYFGGYVWDRDKFTFVNRDILSTANFYALMSELGGDFTE